MTLLSIFAQLNDLDVACHTSRKSWCHNIAPLEKVRVQRSGNDTIKYHT